MDIDAVLEANNQYAKNFGEKAKLAMPLVLNYLAAFEFEIPLRKSLVWWLLWGMGKNGAAQQSECKNSNTANLTSIL